MNDKGPAQLRSAELDRSLENLQEAKDDVSTAESQLEGLLAELEMARRAEKMGVSSAVQGALDRLRAARAKVTEVEALLSSEKERG